MFCTGCGSELKEGQKFCTSCGKEVQAVSVEVNRIDISAVENPSFTAPIELVENNSTQAPDIHEPIAPAVPKDSGTTVLSDIEKKQEELKQALEKSPAGQMAEFNKEPSAALTSVEGKVYSVKKFPSVVGKGSAADVQISGNNAISREHLKFSYSDEKFYIEDLNSSNSTYLNGKKIEPKVETQVIDADEIKLADETFKIELDF